MGRYFRYSRAHGPDGAAWPERERSLYDPAQSRYERAVRRRGIF